MRIKSTTPSIIFTVLRHRWTSISSHREESTGLNSDSLHHIMIGQRGVNGVAQMTVTRCVCLFEETFRLSVVLITSSMPEMELLWKESSTVTISGWLGISSNRVCIPSQGCWTTTCLPCAIGRNSSPKDQNNKWDITFGNFLWCWPRNHRFFSLAHVEYCFRENPKLVISGFIFFSGKKDSSSFLTRKLGLVDIFCYAQVLFQAHLFKGPLHLFINFLDNISFSTDILRPSVEKFYYIILKYD